MHRRDVIRALAVGGGAVAIGGRAFGAEPRVFTSGISLENNRVLVAVGMNGAGPFIFMIDTGAYVSLIRPDLAKQLKLPVQGIEHSRGVGGKGKGFALYLAKDFIIGGGIRQTSVVLQDSFEFGYRQDIYGALAAGVLTTTDTDLDFDKSELRIYPDGRGDRAGYMAIDSEIPRVDQPNRGSRKISAAVTIDGRPIRCILDTGAPGRLILTRAAVRRLGLWNDDRPYAPIRPNGIGGAGPIARIVRVGTLEMGGAREDGPLVTLLDNDVGNGFDGILGLSFIRRFNLSIDTRQRKLWVQSSRQTVPPTRYGLSGLWLDHEGDRISVAAVGMGSPAAAAGLKVGDRIVGEAFPALLRKIGGGPETEVGLKIERGGAASDVRFTLRPYL